MNKYIAALDLGTEEIRGILGKKEADGKVSILAVDTIKAEGITRGLVINVDKVSFAIRELALSLERSSGKKIQKFYVGSGGSQIYALQNTSYKRMPQKGAFSDQLIAELNDENSTLMFENDIELVQVLNQGYTVDDEFRVDTPVGVHGTKIEGDFLLLGMKRNDKETIKRCLEKAGFSLAGILLSPISIANAVLSSEEKQLGAVSVDIGAGKTSIAVYLGGNLVRTVVLPFGGNVITKDLASGCNILYDKAEKAKIKHGSSMAEMQSHNDRITIPATDGWESRELSFKTLAYIIQARMEEILDNVLFQIEKSGVYEKLGAGIVITGGTSKLKDILPLMKLKTGLEIRHGLAGKRFFSNSDAIDFGNNGTAIYCLLADGNENCIEPDGFKSLDNSRKKANKRRPVERTGNLFGSILKSVDNFFDDDDKSM